MSRNRAFLLVASLLTACVGPNPVGHAQADECAVRVIPRIEAGRVYYDVVAHQSRENRQARFTWRQIASAPAGAPASGQPLAACPTAGDASGSAPAPFSRASIGRNADGSFCRLAAGVWQVGADMGSCTAETTFTVPSEIAVGAVVGPWAGSDIALQATSTVTVIDVMCARAVINEPLVLDGNGNFDVSGTYTSTKTGGTLPDLPARFTGRVQGDTMTMNISVDNVTLPHTLTQGRAAPTFGGCR